MLFKRNKNFINASGLSFDISDKTSVGEYFLPNEYASIFSYVEYKFFAPISAYFSLFIKYNVSIPGKLV